MKSIIQYGKEEELCPKCGRLEHLETGLTMTGCYICSGNSASEQKARVKAWGSLAQEMEERIRYLEQERKIDKTGDPELRGRLDLERARLSILSWDGCSSQTGYDQATVSMAFGDNESATRTNIRQAVDAIAKEMMGDNWVEEVLSCVNNSWREDPEAAEGSNSWHGPAENVWDEERDKIVNILPDFSEKDDILFLKSSGPVSDEHYAEGEEDEE